MDKTSRELLDFILKQEPGALRETDIQFLRARASYLTPAQHEQFASVLNAGKEEPIEAPRKKVK